MSLVGTVVSSMVRLADEMFCTLLNEPFLVTQPDGISAANQRVPNGSSESKIKITAIH